MDAMHISFFFFYEHKEGVVLFHGIARLPAVCTIPDRKINAPLKDSLYVVNLPGVFYGVLNMGVQVRLEHEI